MNKEEIAEIIKNGESETLEFKPTLSQINEIIETLSAFANKKGGKILVGISGLGKVVGVEIGKDTIEKLTNKIQDNIEPKIYPKIPVIEIEKKTVIFISAQESKEKPVWAFGRAYKRVGKSTLKICRDELKLLMQENIKKSFDSEICEDASLSDIEEEKVKWFLEKAKFERNFDVDLDTEIKDALKKLNFMKDNRITNAAILLFGKNTQGLFPQAEIRCARFKGTKPIEFIDMKVFRESIIDQRENAIEFIKEHIKLHAKIVGTERIEEWEYPLEAIREAITNAICHRDYEAQSNVQVRIFDDRLEIWNPGTLPPALTVEKLKGKHESILRNKLIGKCFFLIKYIEQWGTGTNRIIELCNKVKLPEPLFEDTKSSFVLTFRKYYLNEEILQTLNERQKKALQHLLKNKKITNKEYRELNQNISDRTALNDFKDLISKKILFAKGGKRGRVYMLR